MAAYSNAAIGIDLGTTNCCLAFLRHHDQEPEIIHNEVGRNTSPSYVAYADIDEDGDEEVIAGQTAKDLAVENAERTVFDVKRLIGQTFHDPQIQRYNQLWPFQLVNCKGTVGVKIGEEVLLPQDILKELILHLLNTAKDFLHFAIQSAVITVPVYFSDLQRGLIFEAGRNAGLINVQLINEPTAAALAYSLQPGKRQQSWTKRQRTCLIFDLGGGTFDLTLFKLGPENRIKIIGIAGDPRLGGDDFNELLTEHCIKSFEDTTGINLTADVIQGHLNRCLEIVNNCLRHNGIAKDQLDDVVLIGGSSRIPKVQEMLSDLFGMEKIRRSIDADEAVACGAAIHAYNTFHRNGRNETLETPSASLDGTLAFPMYSGLSDEQQLSVASAAFYRNFPLNTSEASAAPVNDDTRFFTASDLPGSHIFVHALENSVPLTSSAPESVRLLRAPAPDPDPETFSQFAETAPLYPRLQELPELWNLFDAGLNLVTTTSTETGEEQLDARMMITLDQLESMGFANNDGSLTRLVISNKGDLNEVLKTIGFLTTNSIRPVRPRMPPVTSTGAREGQFDTRMVMTLNQLESMGFSNNDGLLVPLISSKNGDLDEVLNALLPD